VGFKVIKCQTAAVVLQKGYDALSDRGCKIYQAPPNSQGFTGLMTLNILENYDFSQIEHGSFDYYHLLIEALKKSFQHRISQHFIPVLKALLQRLDQQMIIVKGTVFDRYAKQLAEEIGNVAAPTVSRPVGSDTAYAAVADAEGNAVSFIQSLYFEFGSAVTAGETGMFAAGLLLPGFRTGCEAFLLYRPSPA
jgi:gamma-glutamyltranspeptidase